MKHVYFIISLLFISPLPAVSAEFGLLDWHGATGGVSRSPNSAYYYEQDNNYFEAWIQQSVTVFRHDRYWIDLYGKKSFIQDTQDNPWNNLTAFTYGVNLNAKITADLSVYYDLSHETHDRDEGRELDAIRQKLGFNYYKQWWIGEPSKLPHVTHNKRVLKLWGSINFPASVNPDSVEKNITFNPGGEYANHYEPFGLGIEVVPYLYANATIDRNGEEFANKLRFGRGTRLLYPLKTGELYIQYGTEYEYRWLSETTEQTEQLTAGWYVSW